MTDWSNRPENRLSVAEAAYLLNASEQFYQNRIAAGNIEVWHGGQNVRSMDICDNKTEV